MVVRPTQLPITYKGKQYSGVYSASGSLVIARIPGIDSKSRDLADAGTESSAECAQTLLQEILETADQAGAL